tara:strand:- start:407 stop:571 length:165 start_codon:yes stop_codon:yes gene_type:complete
MFSKSKKKQGAVGGKGATGTSSIVYRINPTSDEIPTVVGDCVLYLFQYKVWSFL